jgi:hypothetical protein
MKKIAVVLFAVLILSACAPVSQGFVALPDSLKLAIEALAVLAVSAVVQFAIAKLQFLAFLLPYAREWGLALSALVIPWLENLLPGGAFAYASILAVQFVLAVIAGVLAMQKLFVRRGLLAR